MSESHRKQRARSHIIADLSVNHVEYFALKCGFSVERIKESDYGYDLQIYTYNENGEIENGAVYLQLKATDNIERYEREGNFSYSLERAHLEIWLNEPMPVLLMLFDVQNEVAYWVYLQAYFEQSGISLESINQKTLTVHLDKKNIVDTDAIKKWREYKNNILSQLEGYIKHA
jgi:hypothetical protein